MLFSRIAMDIAPFESVFHSVLSLVLQILLCAVAIGLLTFAVIFTVVRRKKAKAREQEQKLAEQKNKEPGK